MPNYTLRTLKLSILEAMAREQERPTHKVNLLGRPGQPGNLERHLGCVFDSSTRAQALRAMDRLQHDGLVTPTYADLVAPESWLVLTESGHAALRRRAMDPLDEALVAISPHLMEMRDGAWSAVASSEADALRQAAHSARELIDQTLKISAPDEQVKVASWYQPDSGSQNGVTRRHRLRFIMEQHRHIHSESELRIAEKACELVHTIGQRLLALSHSREVLTRADVYDAMLAAEIAFRRVLVPHNADGERK